MKQSKTRYETMKLVTIKNIKDNQNETIKRHAEYKSSLHITI